MAHYEKLSTFTLPQDNQLIHPNPLPPLVHLEDPAHQVFIDFYHVHPATISASETIDHALEEIRLLGMHWLLIVDKSQKITGFISSEEILGEKPIRFMQQRKVERNEVLVRMVMTKPEEMLAVDFDQLKHAKVGHIFTTLKQEQKRYLFVVEKTEKDGFLIRGLFSLSQINERLHLHQHSDSDTQPHI